MENKVRFDNKGELSISDEAISTIVSIAAKEVEGVSGLKHNISEQLATVFSKAGHYYNGVKVLADENGIVLDVNMKVHYGSKVSDLAIQVQENIKSAIEAMLDIKVAAVNVHVLGIDFEK